MPRHYRVPADITAPYATRLGGEWKGRRTPRAAWAATYKHLREHPGEPVLVVSRDGSPLPEPEVKPRPSGPSGAITSPVLQVVMPADLLEQLDAECARSGLTRSGFVRSAILSELVRLELERA